MQKCRIVRDGKLKIDISNEDAKKDKVIFLKWEKLSNWNSSYETRKTGAGTNTDVRVRGSNTDTLPPPTWTYFGGGYFKPDNSFIWEEFAD